MKKHFLCVVLLFSFAQLATAAPPKGYLSAVEIKRLLDLFPDGTNIEDVRAIFGAQAVESIAGWSFEEYNIRIVFQKKTGNRVSDMSIVLHFDSSMERYKTSILYIQQFDTLTKNRLQNTDTQTIWEGMDGYFYGMTHRNIDSGPVLIFARIRKQ